MGLWADRQAQMGQQGAKLTVTTSMNLVMVQTADVQDFHCRLVAAGKARRPPNVRG